jgi:hypothetical protein
MSLHRPVTAADCATSCRGLPAAPKLRAEAATTRPGTGQRMPEIQPC